jgi:hypothetical protein
MYKSLFPALVVTLAAAAACATGYALRENPAPSRSAAAPSPASDPAQAQRAFPDQQGLSVSTAGGGEQGARKTDEFATGGGRSRAFESGTAKAEFQHVSGGLTGDPAPGGDASAGIDSGVGATRWNRPDAEAVQFQPGAIGAYNAAKGPPAPPSVPIPLAFVPLPPGAAADNPRLAAAVQALQQGFVDAMGGPNQDPNDPAYYQRWITAQQNNDELYHLEIGDNAYLLEQIRINTHGGH